MIDNFSLAYSMNSLMAGNDSLTQAFEQSALFPTASADTVQFQGDRGKLFSRQVQYAVGKSVNGKPTYYAEVGPKGRVTFVENK